MIAGAGALLSALHVLTLAIDLGAIGALVLVDVAPVWYRLTHLPN